MTLTQEDFDKLSAPVPASEIKSYPGKGGKQMRYTSVDFVEKRIASVDPNWQKEVTLGNSGVAVHYTICGVRRGDMYDNEFEAKYGAPQVNALARACRRAGRNFGIAEDLWMDEEQDTADEKPQSQSRQSSGTSGNVSKFKSKSAPAKESSGEDATPGQVRYMTNRFMQVPQAIAKELSKNEASALLDYIKGVAEKDQEEYDANPNQYIQTGLKKARREDLVYLLDEGDEDED